MKLSNVPYDRLEVGQEASLKRLCTADDFLVFAHSSGNLNPMHRAHRDAGGDTVEALAPSMWIGAIVSSVLGNILPGPGSLYRAQSIRFLGRAHAGDELTVGVRVKEKLPDFGVAMEVWVHRQDGTRIAEGTAEVEAPATQLSFDDVEIPGLMVQKHVLFDAMIERAEPLPPLTCAVVVPEEPSALGGALLAMRHSIIRPILVGDEAKIRAVAAELGQDLGDAEIVHADGHSAAAAAGVALVHEGRAQALMKGHVHTDELLHHVVKREGGLRTRRRLSHVFVFDVPGMDHLVMVTDAAINIAPDLEAKVDITQNAIDLALALGVEQPKVGILSAVETVNTAIPSTLDAAILSKMADRGQIVGGLVDGPLAMDNAMSLEAAKTKGIRSLVAGRADVLVVPNLEAGNMLAKQMVYAAHAEGGGLVLGAKVPVILTSRADDDKARLASCAIAALYQRWQAEQSNSH